MNSDAPCELWIIFGSVFDWTLIKNEDIKFARKLGYKIKLIGSSEIINNKIISIVEPTLVNITSQLSNVDGVLNGIKIQTDHLSSLFLEGHRLVDMRHYGKTGELPIDRPERGDSIEMFPIPESETPGWLIIYQQIKLKRSRMRPFLVLIQQ